METNNLHIGIIIGSTREARFSEQPAQWIFAKAAARTGITAELLDLRDYPLPFYEEAQGPSSLKGNYKNEVAKKWLAKVATCDAYIIVTPEYNHGYPAVLKNALDYVYYEWNKKPVSFVSYGGVGGARAIEQLRLVSIELQMAPLSTSVNITGFWSLLDEKGKLKSTESFDKQGDKLLDQLTWWGHALKEARNKTA
jgi:NAD(P)H-dependent FMN reductase